MKAIQIKNNYWSILCLFFLLFSSCEKTPPEPPDPYANDPRNRFMGKYTVYKTENNDVYEMEIIRLGEPAVYGQTAFDSIQIINLVDLFPPYNRVFKSYGDTNRISFIWGHGIKDKYGNRWSAYDHHITPFAPISNRLQNDTIYVCIKLSNIQFYYEDGVPYMDTILTHIAVKQK